MSFYRSGSETNHGAVGRATLLKKGSSVLSKGPPRFWGCVFVRKPIVFQAAENFINSSSCWWNSLQLETQRGLCTKTKPVDLLLRERMLLKSLSARHGFPSLHSPREFGSSVVWRIEHLYPIHVAAQWCWCRCDPWRLWLKKKMKMARIWRF